MKTRASRPNFTHGYLHDEFACSRGGMTRAVSGSARVWDIAHMDVAVVLDRGAIAHVCARYGVARLRVFGSLVTGGFDPDRSDIDFIVDFLPEVHDLLGNYIALNEELERIVGRKVDLVMSDAIENRYFAAGAFRTARDVYAA